MREIIGDIFDLHLNYDAICITTNGMIKKDGKAIMGAGVAKACRDTVKGSDSKLAIALKDNGNIVQVFDTFEGVNVVAFPTKDNWRDKSDIELIKTSACQLAQLMDANGWGRVLLPQPGCTNGGLNWNNVKKEIEPFLNDSVDIISKGKILECSSKGDKRFSAFYAKVMIFGKYDSIENHYQLSKRIDDLVPKNWKEVKGKKPTHLSIGGHDYDLKYTEAWYDTLWVAYLNKNPDLVKYAKQFDDFTDMFKSKNAVVCQADSIRKYINNGKKSVLEEHSEFIELVRKNKK